MAFNADKIINGTHGDVWCDNVKWANVKGCQGKIDKNKEEINIARDMVTKTKTVSISGKGSVTIHKVDTVIMKMELDAINEGRDLKHTIMSKLSDPASYGAETVVYTGVSFDDITLSDWEVAKLGEVELPFTFEKAEYLDYID